MGSLAHGAGGCDRQSLSYPVKSPHLPPRVLGFVGCEGMGAAEGIIMRIEADWARQIGEAGYTDLRRRLIELITALEV